MRGRTALSSVIALLGGLERGELSLAYQPIYDVRRGEVRAVEALLRWRHPDRGELAPGEFLPDELRGGLAQTVTAFVLAEAVAQCGRWACDGLDVAVSVNVPPGALVDDSVPSQAATLLAYHDVAPDRLTVEITEQACVGDLQRVRPACTALTRQGIRLSLDDFGIGDSSLARLQQLQFDELKIDRAFVSNAPNDPTDRHIVDRITQLAHDLGIHVVAEGVETEASCQLMVELNVNYLQGFYLHRPGTAEQITPLLASTPIDSTVSTARSMSPRVVHRTPHNPTPSAADPQITTFAQRF